MKPAPGLVAVIAVIGLAGCAGPRAIASPVRPRAVTTALTPSPTATTAPTVMPTPKPTPKPKPKPTLKKSTPPGSDKPAGAAPKPPSDGVPTSGNKTFAVAGGATGIVGTGTTLVSYRVEVENGISWGSNPVWTADSFAASVDGIIADPQGWIASGTTPVTDPAQNMTNASWSFQRVSGSSYSVRIRLASPNTTDALCGSVGLQTGGVYSCRYGTNVIINLRRWLTGAPGFAMSLTGYHTMVINHEMGHRLGFKHMLCPGAGQLAPVMQQETINLAGCRPNAYPFAPDGTFVDGPRSPS